MTVRKQPDKSRERRSGCPGPPPWWHCLHSAPAWIAIPCGCSPGPMGTRFAPRPLHRRGRRYWELLHGGLRPQVLVLDALLTKPPVTQVLQEISTMQPDPEPAVLVLVPVPEETAARKALGLFAQYRIMLRPYGMKNLFDEIYRMGTTDDEHRLYHLRRCCEDVLDDFGAQSTLNGYRYAERMLLYALYAERPQKIGDLQQYVASEENIEIGTVTSALNRMSAGMSKRGAEPYRGLCLRCGRPENGVLSNGQLFEGLLKELRRRLEPTV